MAYRLFCLPCVLWLTLRRTFFLGRPSSGFHTSHWTSWGSLGFSSVWSLCQEPTIFFSLIYFLILPKIWLAPHSQKIVKATYYWADIFFFFLGFYNHLRLKDKINMFKSSAFSSSLISEYHRPSHCFTRWTKSLPFKVLAVFLSFLSSSL